jgi:hypothetical protein
MELASSCGDIILLLFSKNLYQTKLLLNYFEDFVKNPGYLVDLIIGDDKQQVEKHHDPSLTSITIAGNINK